MSTITISIPDEIDERFRETVNRNRGYRKGVLGTAVTEAIELWIEKQNQCSLAEEGRQILLIDHDIGTWNYSHRHELYDRH